MIKLPAAADKLKLPFPQNAYIALLNMKNDDRKKSNCLIYCSKSTLISYLVIAVIVVSIARKSKVTL